MPGRYFTQDTFAFLSKLILNNNHNWFLENKDIYEEAAHLPALAFIADFANKRALISPHFTARPKTRGLTNAHQAKETHHTQAAGGINRPDAMNESGSMDFMSRPA